MSRLQPVLTTSLGRLYKADCMNVLPTLDRDSADTVGGSGTTYSVCEQRRRRWIGSEIENPQPIIDRLNGEIHHHRNSDVIDTGRS